MVNQIERDADYWYAHRHELESGMVFKTFDGSVVKLDRTVPGDGTRWYVLDWNSGWACYDNEIEPGDLRGDPIEGWPSIAKASA